MDVQKELESILGEDHWLCHNRFRNLQDERGKFKKGNAAAWKPGQSGNPKGNKPGRSFTSALKQYLDNSCDKTDYAKELAEKLGLDPEEATLYDLVVAAAAHHAVRGDSAFFKELYTRIEGKPKETVVLEGEVKQTMDLQARIAFYREKLDGEPAE